MYILIVLTIFACQKTYSIRIENMKQQAQIEEGTDG